MGIRKIFVAGAGLISTLGSGIKKPDHRLEPRILLRLPINISIVTKSGALVFPANDLLSLPEPRRTGITFKDHLRPETF